MTSRNLAAGLLAGALASIALAGSTAHAATKVSCVGEQSTHSGHPAAGAGHEWPDELGTVLGTGYAVDNDGDNGHSSVLMNDTGATPVPYTNNGGSYANPANAGIAATGGGGFVRSITAHDVVVIGPWGMHDLLMQTGNALPNTQARFQADYDFLVNIYLKLTPKPRVILTTPLPFPTGGNVTAATQAYMKDAIDPAVKAVATKYNLPIVDLYAIFTAAPATPALLASDGGVNLAGTQKIAMLVAAAITGGSTGNDAGVPDGGGPKDGGAGGSSGASGAAGTTGAAGVGGTAGTGGQTTGTAGTGGQTTGTAGTGGTTTGTAGMSGTTTGTAGDGGTTTGTAGTGGTTTGTAGMTGTTTGTAGTGAPARSSGGGGCAIADNSVAGGIASLLVAVAFAARVTRRRRR